MTVPHLVNNLYIIVYIYFYSTEAIYFKGFCWDISNLLPKPWHTKQLLEMVMVEAT